MTKSNILFLALISFISGIFLSSFFKIQNLIIYELLTLAVFYILISLKEKSVIIFAVCMIFFGLGAMRFQKADFVLENNPIKNYYSKEATIVANIIDEPISKNGRTTFTVKTESVNKEKLESKILITALGYQKYSYGDRLKIDAKIYEPPVFSDFNYKNYLKKSGILAVIYWPKIKIISKNNGNLLYSKILSLKQSLREIIKENLSPPSSWFLAAMTLGDKKDISSQWKEKLNKVGLRHITCISGMHIVILSGILVWVFIMLGFYRGQAFYPAICLLWLFILMTGLQPSAIRAGIMASLFFFSQKIGRQKSASRAILLAASIMLAVNPLLLRFDIGFELSFLATLGIIYLMPLFNKMFSKVALLQSFRIDQLLSITIAAQIFTLPILIYNFGYFSLISPLSNLLIVPALPYIMASGFLFLFGGFVWYPIAWILSMPTAFLLGFLSRTVNFLSKAQFATITLRISWAWLLFFYILLGSLLFYISKKERPKFLTFRSR